SELDTYKRFVEGKRVDGMIVARTHRNDSRIAYLQSSNMPFIVHGRLTSEEQSNFHYIDVDSQLGLYLVTKHLIELGHEKIGLILPQADLAFTDYRWRGYLNALDDHQLVYRPDYCTHGNLTYQSGLDEADYLLTNYPELTAIIATNDWMALGAIASAEQHGRIVGKDFAIAGYDDIPAASQAHPSLTTVHQPIYDVGVQLTKQILDIIATTPTTYHQTLLKPHLVVRESSGDSR
ncbi:MAG: substrate-binding domain-containing protein, partial [Chloroflexota bacterium]